MNMVNNTQINDDNNNKKSQALYKLSIDEIAERMHKLIDWQLSEDNLSITKKYTFKNFKQTMFFINAVAFFCEKKCHHPEINFGYNYCIVTFTTHDVNGLSENDFTCATIVNSLN